MAEAQSKRAKKEDADALAETAVPGSAESAALEATAVGGGDTSQSAANSASQPGQSGAAKTGQPGATKKRKATQLGDFRLVKKLGQGGMGEVFLANQVSLDRKVAIKTLSKELAKKEDFVKRFIREARSMAKLQHQNVVQVYAADSFKGVHYVAIEFIDGQSMQDWMDQQKQLSVGDALHVTLVCAEALKQAHAQNMIHRDIKPDNILVTKKGVIKVADFGLAKALDEDVSMTQSGTGLGTPLYMPPEQARNAKHVDHRTDIYALGCTLYYFLTGQLPFSGENTLELIVNKEKGTYTPARRMNKDVPEKLDLMIGKMIMKDPEHRYSDCASLMKDLAGLNLANPALSFIEGAEEVGLSAIGGPASRAATTKVPKKRTTVGANSAADAARSEAAKLDSKKQWYVRHTNPQGKTVISRMTAPQILQGIKGGLLDLKAKAKPDAHGNFLPLAQFKEFSTAASSVAVKKQAEAKSSDMQSMYKKIDKQHRRRNRWRWLKTLVSGVKGGVSLIIWLAIVAGFCVGLFFAWQYGWPMIQEQFNL